jgi:hypothetical protein
MHNKYLQNNSRCAIVWSPKWLQMAKLNKINPLGCPLASPLDWAFRKQSILFVNYSRKCGTCFLRNPILMWGCVIYMRRFTIKEFFLFIHWSAEPQTSKARAPGPIDVLPSLAWGGEGRGGHNFFVMEAAKAWRYGWSGRGCSGVSVLYGQLQAHSLPLKTRTARNGQ